MAFRLDRCLTKELKLFEEEDLVVTDVKSKQTALMDLSSFVIYLSEETPAQYVQLQDRTVHDITVVGPPIIPDDPYEIPSNRGAIHLFFPEELEPDIDGSELAREFVVKLTMQDNCTVFFHEYSEIMDIQSPAPIIEYELDNELLGNSMIHMFIETKKHVYDEASEIYKNVFYMKSRNCVNAAKIKDKISHGSWVINYRVDGKYVSDVIKNYVDTDIAKIWYSGDDIEDLKRPLIIFDKTKNYWIFSDKDGEIEFIYNDASAKEFYLPRHAAFAHWKP